MVHATARFRVVDTFAGPFALILSNSGELSARFLAIGEARRSLEGATRDPELLPALIARLERYFQGDAVSFDDIPTPVTSGFFFRCWDACRRIPRGWTRSYGELAEMAGSRPAAARAAGAAMRRNPLPVIVPCHRVVAADGSLHGYSGSTDPSGRPLAIKRALLALEGLEGAPQPGGLPGKSGPMAATRQAAMPAVR